MMPLFSRDVLLEVAVLVVTRVVRGDRALVARVVFVLGFLVAATWPPI